MKSSSPKKVRIEKEEDNPETPEPYINPKKRCADAIIIRLDSKLKGIMDLLVVLLAVYSTFTSTYL